ncbi:MAG: hypothetical protein U5K76_16130 [Woeseiaceae bacterium]|nr:hypothetical protein [Woeseiaceae bacterium]
MSVDCIVSASPIRAEIGDSVDYAKAATIRNRVTIDLPDSAATAWRGTVDVPLRDRMNGGIDVAEGRHYVCKTTVGYRPDSRAGAGIALLANRNCDLELQYVEAYRERLQADVAEHRLCREAPFDPVDERVDVGRMVLRGGTPPAQEPVTDLDARTTLERRSKRIGQRFASFPLSGDIEECARACVRDAACRSWSGWQSQRGGRCFLSTVVPPRTDADYTFALSGVVDARPADKPDSPDPPEGVDP